MTPHLPYPALTDREHAVLLDLATGLTDDDISRKDHVAVTTVRTHVRNLRTKYRASSRTETVIKALILQQITLTDVHRRLVQYNLTGRMTAQSDQ